MTTLFGTCKECGKTFEIKADISALNGLVDEEVLAQDEIEISRCPDCINK